MPVGINFLEIVIRLNSSRITLTDFNNNKQWEMKMKVRVILQVCFFFQCINSQSALKKMNASRKLFIIERLHNASMNQNKQAEKLIKKGTCLRELYTLL